MKTAEAMSLDVVEIARRGFENDDYSHEEVFDEARGDFTLREAAEYLEVAEITVRRWDTSGKIAAGRIGRNLVFDSRDLKEYKRENR